MAKWHIRNWGSGGWEVRNNDYPPFLITVRSPKLAKYLEEHLNSAENVSDIIGLTFEEPREKGSDENLIQRLKNIANAEKMEGDEDLEV